jgi:hypothetical protein
MMQNTEEAVLCFQVASHEVRKIIKTSVSNSSCLVQDSNSGPLEYKPGVPTSVPRRSNIHSRYTEALWSAVLRYRAIIWSFV